MPRVTITIADAVPQPYRFDLLREVVTIGRGGDNDIVVSCGSVSGKHAEMRRVSGGYQLIDLDSTNGMKLDGVREKKVSLASGMVVKLGDVEFAFTLNDEEIAALATEAPAGPQEKNPSFDNNDGRKDFPTLPPIDESRVRPGLRRAKEQKPITIEEAFKDEEEEEEETPELVEKSPIAKLGVSFICFLIVAAAVAFFFGADKRHQDATGEGLLKAILNKSEYEKKSAEAAKTPEATE